MAFIIDLYFIVNTFLIKNIPEVVFSIVALMIIFLEPYIVHLERIISSILNVKKSSEKSFFDSIRLDSFLVFLLIVIIVLPLIKHYFMSYVEKVLNSENLLFYLIVLFIGTYIYYVLVHRRRRS